jgi:hypothetical protein
MTVLFGNNSHAFFSGRPTFRTNSLNQEIIEHNDQQNARHSYKAPARPSDPAPTAPDPARGPRRSRRFIEHYANGITAWIRP